MLSEISHMVWTIKGERCRLILIQAATRLVLKHMKTHGNEIVWKELNGIYSMVCGFDIKPFQVVGKIWWYFKNPRGH